jgi:two-component system C4-dicarboxylate transport sensor histidine kinase DctB
MRLPHPLLLIFALLAGALAAQVAGRGVEARALDRMAADAAADAQLRQALMASEIARFRLLPLALSDDRDVVAADHSNVGAARLDAKLEALAGATGAMVMYVIAPNGHAIAASNWRHPDSFVGRDYHNRPYFSDAIAHGAGDQFSMGSVSHKPGLYLARRNAAGMVVVVKLEFDRVEAQWRRAGGITFVTNANGVILVTSRADWRFAATQPLSPQQAATARDRAGVGALRPPPYQAAPGGQVTIDRAADRYLLATTAPDAAGWRVHLAVSTRTVAAQVRSAQIGAAILIWCLLGLGWLGWRRIQQRRERTAALEIAVAERTAELSREIDERIAAETRAADLREGLRQANRLAALGQITASVAHETAQPVAAIRTYAATAQKLLAQGATAQVDANLVAIARLTERIGVVTAELRGFARKSTGKTGPIPLVKAMEGACLLLKEHLSRVNFTLPKIPADMRVIAGRVRLEQVLVNVLQNALDALEGQADPNITVALVADADTLRLTITDNGPGIAPDIADRLFTPFATSRPSGLGLGLVIAQDIMVDFGGTLRALPAEVGACFEITLRRAG